MVAALKAGRNSIGIEIDPVYCRMAAGYLKAESQDLFNSAELKFEKLIQTEKQLSVSEEQEFYRVPPAKKKLTENAPIT